MSTRCCRESRIRGCANKMFCALTGGHADAQARHALFQTTAAFILHQLGITAYNCKNFEVALRFMSLACAQPEAPAQCHRNHAEMLHRCGQLDEAEAAARLAIQRDSDCADAWDTLGTILVDRGALAESRDCYQIAVQIKPDFLAALNNLAVVLHNLGQLDASEAYYRRALNLQPDSLEIQLNFANLLRELKRRRWRSRNGSSIVARKTANCAVLH